jgi:hypothetical protein
MTNQIELNPNMQYILAGDISASMTAIDPKTEGLSRYAYMLEKFKSFIKEAEDFDPDGPTVMLFGESVQVFENTTLEQVDNKLSNIQFEGFTFTDKVLQSAWNLHYIEKVALQKEGKAHPGTTVFVFTDGDPTNRAALVRVITNIVSCVDREDEFNIGFILVGSVTSELHAYLNRLDDELGLKYDIVGVTELEGLTFMKAVNNAVNE